MPRPDSRAESVTTPLDCVTGADLPPLGFSGTEPYDPARFDAPVNEPFSASRKPTGGLWLAPLRSGPEQTPVTDWVAHAHAMSGVRLSTWALDLLTDAKVLRIDSHAAFEAVAAAYPPPRPADWPDEVLDLMDAIGGRGFDYDQIAQDFDALWLTERGCAGTRRTNPGLSTWDIESVLVLHASALNVPASPS